MRSSSHPRRLSTRGPPVPPQRPKAELERRERGLHSGLEVVGSAAVVERPVTGEQQESDLGHAASFDRIAARQAVCELPQRFPGCEHLAPADGDAGRERNDRLICGIDKPVAKCGRDLRARAPR